jgi:hypothetical protein
MRAMETATGHSGIAGTIRLGGRHSCTCGRGAGWLPVRGCALQALVGRRLGWGTLEGRSAPPAGEGATAVGEEGGECSPAATLDPLRGGWAAGLIFLVKVETPLLVTVAAAAGALDALLPLPMGCPHSRFGSRASDYRPGKGKRSPCP